jgi:hypothetical protein
MTGSHQDTERSLEKALEEAGIPPAAALIAVRNARDERQNHELLKVQGFRHNQPSGLILWFAGTGLAMGIVIWLFTRTSDSAFDTMAKAVGPFITLLITALLLLEDPFHEDLGPEARFYERWKLKGKVIVSMTVVGVVCGVLSIFTTNALQVKQHEELLKAEEDAIEQLKKLSALQDQRHKDLLKAEEDAITRLTQLDATSTTTIRTLDSLIKKSESINRAVDQSASSTLASMKETIKEIPSSAWAQGLATRDAVKTHIEAIKDANWAKNLATTQSVKGEIVDEIGNLKKSDWATQLATKTEITAAFKAVLKDEVVVSALATAIAAQWKPRGGGSAGKAAPPAKEVRPLERNPDPKTDDKPRTDDNPKAEDKQATAKSPPKE